MLQILLSVADVIARAGCFIRSPRNASPNEQKIGRWRRSRRDETAFQSD